MKSTTLKYASHLAKLGHLVLAGLIIFAVGCDDSTAPAGSAGSRPVGLSVALSGTGANPVGSLFAQALELTDGANTLVIESAELVLREIEFERVETPGCDSELDNDDCEEFEVGPFLLALPLDGGVAQEITAQVDTGRYDEIEFDIHKPEDDNQQDLDFIAQHPNFADVSIRVTGTYNGLSFVYTTDLNEEQEIALTEPLVVTPDSGPINVTLTIDLATWFLSPGSVLLDPHTANKGEPNENLVTENIRASIEGFRDDDSDGIPHGDDDDELDD